MCSMCLFYQLINEYIWIQNYLTSQSNRQHASLVFCKVCNIIINVKYKPNTLKITNIKNIFQRISVQICIHTLRYLQIHTRFVHRYISVKKGNKKIFYIIKIYWLSVHERIMWISAYKLTFQCLINARQARRSETIQCKANIFIH